MILSLLLPFLLCAAAGACILKYLVAPPLKMSGWLLSGVLCALVAFFGVGFYYAAAGTWLAGSAAGLMGFVGGYLLAAGAFLGQRPAHPIPALTRSQDDAGKGHTAIIYLTHGEPRRYEEAVEAWINFIHEMDAHRTPFIPRVLRPFFFSALRKKYLVSGGSPHNLIHRRIFERLADEENARRTKLRFYLSFLDDNPRPDAAALQALNEGASRILLLNVFLTESSHTEEGLKMITDLHPEIYGVKVCATPPLWDSPALQEMFVHKAAAACGDTPRSQVGILLAGHGQPPAWDELYPKQTAQEIAFRQAVQNRLVQAGFIEDHIRLGWMEFQPPRVSEAAHELFQLPITTLLVFSTAISAEAIHSEVDIPHGVAQAGIPAHIQVINLGAWNDHPLLLDALHDALKSQLG